MKWQIPHILPERENTKKPPSNAAALSGGFMVPFLPYEHHSRYTTAGLFEEQ